MKKEPSPQRAKQTDSRWLSIVGSNIQLQRKLAGLTQEELAEAADLAPRTIQKIEAGAITILISTLRRIRRAIGCSYEVLLAEEK
ncbi:helix-turn-helix domain-containing protein [Termitidicoccus mucosus]|uniref:helix-turn-helix domain-containing protein n=1 Tax=Termitidicoccus mucosus TaxID=1184151 RepID=UPI0009FC2F0A